MDRINLRGLQVDLTIDPRVDLTQMAKGFQRARGAIAKGFQAMALANAEAGVRSARTIRDGRHRHAETKRRRDILKRLRKLELERRGWR